MDKKYTKQERAEVTSEFRRLIVILLVLLFVVFAYIVFSTAWFSMGESVSASGMQANVRTPSGRAYSLYLWDEELNSGSGGWSETSGIDMLSAVPNQCNRYLLITDASVDDIIFNLSAVNESGENPATENLYSYIFINKSAEYVQKMDPATFVTGLPSAFGYAQAIQLGSVASSVELTGTYGLSCSNAKTVVFDVYISKEVCDYFALWGFTGTVIAE